MAVSGKSVAVFGAAGHTGRFVVAELVRRGLTPIAVVRDLSNLGFSGLAGEEIERRTASIDDPASLERAVAGAAAVINCAGPFLDTAHAVASAALALGLPYLDVTAEQASAQATLDHFDRPARDAGVVVLPAMGFYGGFADLLVAAAMGDWTEADDIEIAIALDSWRPTRGTRATGARNTAERLVIASGKLAPLALPAVEKTMTFPQPFGRQAVFEVPFSEVILIARRVKTRELHTYLAERALRDIRDPLTPPPSPADDSGRSAQRFAVQTTVRSGRTTRGLIATGRDIYAFTAPLVCGAVERILAGEVKVVGAHPPGALFDAPAFLSALTRDDLILEVVNEAQM